MLANNDPRLLTLCKKIALHYDNTSSTVTKKTILAHWLAKFKFVLPFSVQWLTTELVFNVLELSQINCSTSGKTCWNPETDLLHVTQELYKCTRQILPLRSFPERFLRLMLQSLYTDTQIQTVAQSCDIKESIVKPLLKQHRRSYVEQNCNEQNIQVNAIFPRGTTSRLCNFEKGKRWRVAIKVPGRSKRYFRVFAYQKHGGSSGAHWNATSFIKFV